MRTRQITFQDGYWYCYANSAAMLLSSIGKDVPPRLIEVLSGVGLGAFFSPGGGIGGGLPFFSGLASAPDAGITRALSILGFASEVRTTTHSESAPFDELAQALTATPAILGPFDMCLLSYNPARPTRSGIDHFIVADRLEADHVVVYDPAGFAEAIISKAALKNAWRADAITYKGGHYQYWAGPRRLSRPSDDQIVELAITSYKRLYREADRQATETGCLTDEAAIAHLGDLVRTSELTAAQSGHLLHFALPLGAKRALDFALFFDAVASGLPELKRRQAVLFGQCFSNLALGKTPEVVDDLARLGATNSLSKLPGTNPRSPR